MATYGIYGGQYGASAPAQKPKASDMFAPNSAPAVAQGAQPAKATPATGAPPPNPFGGAGTNPFGPVAPAANPGSFESLLNNAGPARQQNVQAAQKTVSEQLMPSPLPSRESATARSAFIKAQEEAGRKNAESSSLSGRLLTGQASGDVANFNRESLGQRADLENKLAINDASRADAQKQQGVSNLLSMEQLASGERVADKGLASTEKLHYADLNQEDKALAQAGSQFDKKLDFDTWAKNQDIGEADRDRVWKSIEAQKGRVFTSSESALDRTLNSSQFAETIGLSKQQFGEQIRQFDSKQDFDKWATQKGLDAEAAKLVWQSNENDIGRKWGTGERLSTQEHQVNLTRLQGEVDKDKALFSQALGVQTMEKQAEIDTLASATANEYQTARDTRAMSHDQAMEEMKASMTAKLEQAGYDHQTAMQAAEIHATAVEKTKDREMATLEAKAELAYKYNALASEEGISKETIAQRREESAGQLSLGLQQLGLDKTKIDAAIKSQDFQDRSGMIATMMEMGGDSADVADKAGAMFTSLLHEKGLISDEEFKNGLAGITSRTPEAKAPRDPDKIYAPKTGIDLIDNPVGDITDSYNQLSKGNFVTAAKHAGTAIATYPVRALKALKFW